MNKIILEVPEFKANGKPLLYLSEWEGFELPKGILAKGGTGVGGSTLAIDSKHPYIITVPTTALIQNKQEKHDKIFAVHFGASNHYSLADYLKNTDVPIFMVTYDSLSKLVNQLSELGIEPCNEYRLLVDEYTELLNAYSYRDKAINSLLRVANSFEYVTYMSATPIPEEYTPKVFKEFNYTELVWKNVFQVKPIIKSTNKPYNLVANILKQFKVNGYSHKIGINTTNELFIFINSVKAIKGIIDAAKLLPSEVKIICADTDANKETLDVFSIDKPIGDNKPINFLTSKAFSGCDINSKSGLSIVVSNVSNKNTLVDIATDIYQIAGRIRDVNNPFKSTIYHIYNTGAVEMSKEEFNEWVKNKKDVSNIFIDDFNKYDERRKVAYKKRMELNLEDAYTFYNEETNELEFDDMKEMNEARQFYITNDIYANGVSMRQAYLKEGYDIDTSQRRIHIEEEFISTIGKYSVAKQLQDYCRLQKELKEEVKSLDYINSSFKANEMQNKIRALEFANKHFKEAYTVLGANGIETRRYSMKAIQQSLYEESNEAKEVIKHSVFTKFKNGGFYSSVDITKVLQEAYDRHKVKKKAKAVDIESYLQVVSTIKKIEGKSVRGYEIKIKSLLKISESLCCVMPFAASNGTLVEAGLLSWLSKTAIIGLFEQLKYTETLIFNRL